MTMGLRSITLSIAALAVAAVPGYALEFPTTSDRGAPSRGPALATRGDVCIDASVQPSLTSLVPRNAIATGLGIDPSIAPALWFYLPETEAPAVELLIFDELGEEHYSQTLPLDQTSLPTGGGTLSMALPDRDSLSADSSTYYWEFAIICDPADREEDLVVGGSLERLTPSATLTEQLAATPADDLLKRAELYAAAGAWQETIALAAALRAESPEVWTQLLTSVGLESVGEAALGKPPVSAAEATTPANPVNSRPQRTLMQLLEGVVDRGDQ